MSEKEAELFYEHLRGQPFFPDLVASMTADPMVALLLEKENAVEDYRKLLGSKAPDNEGNGNANDTYVKTASNPWLRASSTSIHGLSALLPPARGCCSPVCC